MQNSHTTRFTSASGLLPGSVRYKIKFVNEKSRLLTLNALSIKEQSHIYYSLIQWGMSTKMCSKNMCVVKY